MRVFIVLCMSLMMAMVTSAEVTCKYCGQKRQSVQALVTAVCLRHPDGVNKGKHSPAR